MKLKFFFLILFSAALFAQPGLNRNPILTEINIIPADSVYKINISFKVSFRELVFEKNGQGYSSQFSYWVEIFDSNEVFVNRQIKDHQINAASFEETNQSGKYFEGIISMNITEGSYKIFPIFTDKNSGSEFKLPPKSVDTKLDSGFLSPIVINSDLLECGAKPAAVLANFEGAVPFSDESYDVIIPVRNEIQQIFVTVMNRKDTVFRESVSEYFLSDLNFTECGSSIVIEKSGNNFRNFILKGLNKKLIEGGIIIFVSTDKNSTEKKRFNLAAKWFDKPESIFNPGFAIKALRFIESADAVDNLLKNDEENYMKALVEFWLKYDPDPLSTYNPLMTEYYKRVDHAFRSFATITGQNGLETDRGKIYVQFGKPSKTQRTSDDYGKVIETWFYEKPHKTFVFIDKRGTGNFSLKD